MFRFIDAEKGNFDVVVMCRVLGVSRSGYYAWARRPPSERTLANATLVEEIRRVHAESDGTYGSRRVHAELRREGHEVNIKRVERLMRVEGIQGAYVPPKRRRNPDCALGVDGVKVWPDLVKRDFQPDGPNQLWCSDMKQIPTGEGVLHLASVLDCFSRRIVGWAMGPVADAPLVARALEMAVAQRRPGEGIIHHADRGCQYTAVTFGAACRAHGITQSNSRKGSPHDNAAKESFFASLEGAAAPAHVRHPRTGAQLDLPVHRGVLQPPPVALHARVPLPRRGRARASPHARRRRGRLRGALPPPGAPAGAPRAGTQLRSPLGARCAANPRALPEHCPQPALTSSVRALSYSHTVNIERVHGTGGGPVFFLAPAPALDSAMSRGYAGRPPRRRIVEASMVFALGIPFRA